QLLAVGGRQERLGAVEHGLLFALLEVVVDDGRLLLGRPGARQAPVEHLARHRRQAVVVARFVRQRHDAGVEPVDVDGHRLGLLLLLGLLVGVVRRRLVGSLGVGLLAVGLALVLVPVFLLVLVL